MDQHDDVSDTESEAYLGDEAGNVDQHDQEVADLQGAEAGMFYAMAPPTWMHPDERLLGCSGLSPTYEQAVLQSRWWVRE